MNVIPEFLSLLRALATCITRAVSKSWAALILISFGLGAFIPFAGLWLSVVAIFEGYLALPLVFVFVFGIGCTVATLLALPDGVLERLEKFSALFEFLLGGDL